MSLTVAVSVCISTSPSRPNNSWGHCVQKYARELDEQAGEKDEDNEDMYTCCVCARESERVRKKWRERMRACMPVYVAYNCVCVC